MDNRRNPNSPPASASAVRGFPVLAAHDLLGEIAPLLAARGMSVDMAGLTRQSRLAQAGTRHSGNAVLSPGPVRDQAAAVLRSMVDAVTAGDITVAADHLDGLAAYSLDDRTPSAYSCIALALALLDDWLASTDLPTRAVVPAALAQFAQATTDIGALAGKGRALRSRASLITRHGSRGVLWASALALEATTRELAHISGAAVTTSPRSMIR